MEKQIKIEVINPIEYFSTIGEELVDIISSNNMSIEQFVDYMKWSNIEIPQLKKLSKADLSKINEIFGNTDISTYLSNFQSNYILSQKEILPAYKSNLKIFNKIKHIIPLMKNQFNDGVDVLADLSDFLNIENEENIFDQVEKNIALYKISNFVPDNLNLYAWLRRGEIDFNSLNLKNYNKDEFVSWIENNEWKQNLNSSQYLLSLPSILKDFGIGLVYTPYLDKTVHGAVRWFDNKPLIQVSDKGKCLATIWYTLFHEIGHVLIHENDEIFEGNMDLPKAQINKKEREANEYAYDKLFNGDSLRKFIFMKRNQFVDDNFISSTSSKFSAPKIFVSYWMKKANVRSRDRQNYLPTISFIN